MTARSVAAQAAPLLAPSAGRFSEDEIAGLPAPVQRYFTRALAPGTRLLRSVHIDMTGRIKVGRWLPFRAREVLNPRRGFIWAARAAGLISGSDRYVGGAGAMEWKLAGLVPVMRAEGPHVSRSAAERAAAEAVWVPAALLPRFGVDWSVGPHDDLVAAYGIDDHLVRINLALGDDGKVRTVTLDRWGDPDGTGTFGLHTFGGEFHEHGTFEGMTIPTAGRLGWHYGTARWKDGEFFQYRIVNLQAAGR